MSYKYWTNHEVSYLSENWGKIPCGDIAKYLGKTPNTVRLKASRLGLKSPLPHKLQKVSTEELMELIDLGYHAMQIGLILGIDRKNVYNLVKNRKGMNTKEHKYYLRLKNNTKEYWKRMKNET